MRRLSGDPVPGESLGCPVCVASGPLAGARRASCVGVIDVLVRCAALMSAGRPRWKGDRQEQWVCCVQRSKLSGNGPYFYCWVHCRFINARLRSHAKIIHKTPISILSDRSGVFILHIGRFIIMNDSTSSVYTL